MITLSSGRSSACSATLSARSRTSATWSCTCSKARGVDVSRASLCALTRRAALPAVLDHNLYITHFDYARAMREACILLF
jgi:hypothetical protein